MSCVTFYLSSPNTQQQADALSDMPVLLSYAVLKRKADFASHWMNNGFHQSFSRVLVDSGAYSAMNSGKMLDVLEYAEWAHSWIGHADAIAGLDDIGGDWRKSMRNYEAQPYAFPTMHDTDPPELLDDLVAMARERGGLARNWSFYAKGRQEGDCPYSDGSHSTGYPYSWVGVVGVFRLARI